MMANSIPNFRVGLQATDEGGRGGEGEPTYTPWAKDVSAWSDWAMDSDQFDPDGVRIGLEVEPDNLLTDRDIRLEIQAADGNQTGEIAAPGVFYIGPKQFGPWASAGGGWTGLALDPDANDPNAFRVKVQTAPWTSTRTLRDFRLGIQMFDFAGREMGTNIEYTPWASEGGGWSEYALDRDQFDPDGFKVKLEVRFL